MCQLSKMLTQHKPSLSWCSLLANGLQMLQEKSSLNCASCCLPRLSWRTSQTAWHVPHYILSAPSCRSSMWSSVFSRARFKLHHLKDNSCCDNLAQPAVGPGSPVQAALRAVLKHLRQCL